MKVLNILEVVICVHTYSNIETVYKGVQLSGRLVNDRLLPLFLVFSIVSLLTDQVLDVLSDILGTRRPNPDHFSPKQGM